MEQKKQEDKEIQGPLKRHRQDKERMKQLESTLATSLRHLRRLMGITQRECELHTKGEIMKGEAKHTMGAVAGHGKNSATTSWEQPR